jgi:hypothetical protein
MDTFGCLDITSTTFCRCSLQKGKAQALIYQMITAIILEYSSATGGVINMRSKVPSINGSVVTMISVANTLA